MAKSIARSSEGLSNANMYSAIQKIQRTICDVALTTGGLVIGSSAAAKVKIATTVYGWVNGILVKKTTAEIAISGTITADKFNVYVLTLKSDGTVTVAMGTEGATIGAVVMPTIPDDEAVIGFVIINPTGTGNFVGGTTELGDTGVVPNAVYVDTPYPFNPNADELG